MILVDGKKIANDLLEGLSGQIAGLDFRPLFVDVMVGSDPVSLSYVNVKERAVSRIGCDFKLARFPATMNAGEIIAQIENLQKHARLRGLIVQLPLPEGIEKPSVLNSIFPEFDIDCIGRENLSRFYEGNPRFVPPTAAAVLHILDLLKINLRQKKIVIVGRGDLVGKPVARLLAIRGVRAIPSGRTTSGLSQMLKEADVVVSATGQPGLITGDRLKSGCVVIDAGTSESSGSIVGDVNRQSVESVAAILSPVPGGIGPVAVAMLCKNLVLSILRPA